MAWELIADDVKKSSDLEVLANIAYTHFGILNGIYDFSDYKKELDKWMNNPANSLVIAYDNDAVLGFSLYGKIYAHEIEIYRSAARKRGPRIQETSADIKLIAVQSDKRRNGIGSSILKRVIDDTKQVYIPNMFAVSWMGNGGQSFGMFKKLGFKELDSVEGIYSDGSLGIVLVKEL